jgi:hypothetical protein
VTVYSLPSHSGSTSGGLPFCPQPKDSLGHGGNGLMASAFKQSEHYSCNAFNIFNGKVCITK